MRSMAIDRRGFLLGGAALLAAPTANAEPLREIFFSVRADADRYEVVAFDGSGAILLEHALPERGHAVTVRPDGSECVAVARRPGEFAIVVDIAQRTAVQEFAPTPGRTFAGHAVYSADGRHLLLTEDDAELEQGFVAMRDVADGYRAVASFPTCGIGPHELLWPAGGRLVAVANGGILTGPDSGGMPLNLDTMHSSLALIDAADGGLHRLITLPNHLHQLSIRHLAALHGDRLALGMQWQGSLEDDVPLVGIVGPGGEVRFLDLPEEIAGRPLGYVGSVAADAGGRWLAASAPRGNCVLFWDGDSCAFAGAVDIADGCGLSPTASIGEFLLTSGAGIVERVVCEGGLRRRRLDSAALMQGQWDNHVTLWNRPA
jgi:hypothetical protein